MHRIILIFALLVMACAPVASAEIKFRTISTTDGLSNNHVNAVFRDSKGFMWFGTASGLNRYDGYSFKVFHRENADSTCLHDNYISEIQEDKDGNLWILAGDEYTIYNPELEAFKRFTISKANAEGLPECPNIIRIDGNDFWYAVRNHGLYRRSQDNKTRHILQLPTEVAGITDISAAGEHGITLATSDDGVMYIIDYLSNKLRDSVRIPNAGDVPTDYSIFIDSNACAWIYSIWGADCYDITQKQWRKAPVKFKNMPIRSISEDGEGNIWIGYDNNGVEVISPDGSSKLFTHMPLDKFSLGNNSVKTIFHDKDNGMWVGTYKRGVSLYCPNEYKFSSRIISDINCIYPCVDDPESVWLGTDRDGLLRYNLATGEKRNIDKHSGTIENAIVCITPDDKEGLYVGTYNGGLKYYKGNSVKHIRTSDGLASANVWAMLHNDDGTLWLGTLGGGLQLYNPADGSFRTFNNKNTDLPSNYISTLSRGPQNTLYIGTTNGLYTLNTSDYSIRPTTRNNLNLGIGNKNINQCLTDSRGLLWAATREGLNVYDLQADTIYEVPLNNDYSRMFILGLAEGAGEKIWVTAGGELYNVTVNYNTDKSIYEFKSVSFDENDGLHTGTFNQRSMCKLPSGTILAGGMNGIAIIEPKKISYDEPATSIIFTDLYLNNTKIDIGKKYNGNVVLPKALNSVDKIVLESYQNDFSIYFASGIYSNSALTRYQYRLNGYDSRWMPCPEGMHHVAYTNLSSGRYTLQIRAVNADGVPYGVTREIGITIKSPWWATWWAKTIYALFTAFSFIALILYIKKREQQKFHLKQQEDKAKKEYELNQLKFRFFTNISHELRTPLTLILSPVDSMLKECSTEKDLRRLSTIKTNATRLLYLVNQLLDFRKNEIAGLNLHLSSGDMVSTLRQICQQFGDVSERRNIDIYFEPQVERLDMSFDNDKITKTVMNLLSNAVKYTPEGGKITVSLKYTGDKVLISVADTGKGISANDKEHIFERFYRTSDKSDTTTGTGIGLSLVAEYVKLHDGTVEVSDNTPCGSVFTIILPYRNDPGEQTAPHRDEAADNPESALPDAESTDNYRPKILFVDDNSDLTRFLKDEFENDFDVSCAADGVEALAATEKESFDVIVSDLMMPNMDGIQLCRHIKANPATVDIPFVMLTAKHDVDSVIEGLTLGADEYITKPFNNAVLAIKIKRLTALKQRGMRRTLIEPSPSEIKITSLDEQLVEKAVKYVEDNMQRSDLTVEELSRGLGMSRVHLYKKLLALTGKTPVEFIRVMRLKRAAQYLRESQLTVAEIAYKLGFNNPKYFSKYFKEEFGISPSEYQSREGV